MTSYFTSTTFRVQTIILVLTILLAYSCKPDYHRSYKDFDDFNAADGRAKSNFPRLISENCFDIKLQHYLDERDTTNYDFGVFSYTDSQKMTSVLADTVNKKVSIESLQYCLDQIPSSGIPDWFIKRDQIKSSDIYLNERYFIIDMRQDKQIYFVYDGSYRSYDTLNKKTSETTSPD